MDIEEIKTFDRIIAFWIISCIICFVTGLGIATLIASDTTREDYNYNKDLERINAKLDLLKEDTNSILYNETKLVECRLTLQSYRDKLLYVYADNLLIN